MGKSSKQSLEFLVLVVGLEIDAWGVSVKKAEIVLIWFQSVAIDSEVRVCKIDCSFWKFGWL